LETSQNNNIINLGKHLPTIISVLCCGFFIYLLKPLLFIDYWYDEVLSLEEFILVPLQKTVTDYSVPNNHIFFSILMNIWLKLWGINSFAAAANNVFIIRSLPLLFTAITMFFVYRAGRMFGKHHGLLAIAVLLTTIPFYNFAVQIRGYGLSIMLSSMLLFYTLSFYKEPKKRIGIRITLLTALLLYTIPSNLYAILSVLMILGAVFLNQWYKYHFLVALQFNAAKLIQWLLLGIGIGVLLYLPVGSQVVNNEYVKSEGFFRWEIWQEAITFYTLLYTWDWVFYILLGVGLLQIQKDRKTWEWVLVFLLILILPFLISFVRGGKPFDRTFLWLIPVFAVGVSIIVGQGFKQIKSKLNIFLQILFSTLLIFFLLRVTANRAYEKYFLPYYTLNEEIKTQNIHYSYYLANYNPHKNLKNFKAEYYKEGTQVFLHEVDKYAMHGYLPMHGIKWQPFTDTIPKLDKYYIITAFENKAIEEFEAYDTAFEFRNVSGEIDFVNIIEAKRKQ
jgi:hypothetical protein